MRHEERVTTRTNIGNDASVHRILPHLVFFLFLKVQSGWGVSKKVVLGKGKIKNRLGSHWGNRMQNLNGNLSSLWFFSGIYPNTDMINRVSWQYCPACSMQIGLERVKAALKGASGEAVLSSRRWIGCRRFGPKFQKGWTRVPEPNVLTGQRYFFTNSTNMNPILILHFVPLNSLSWNQFDLNHLKNYFQP